MMIGIALLLDPNSSEAPEQLAYLEEFINQHKASDFPDFCSKREVKIIELFRNKAKDPSWCAATATGAKKRAADAQLAASSASAAAGITAATGGKIGPPTSSIRSSAIAAEARDSVSPPGGSNGANHHTPPDGSTTSSHDNNELAQSIFDQLGGLEAYGLFKNPPGADGTLSNEPMTLDMNGGLDEFIDFWAEDPAAAAAAAAAAGGAPGGPSGSAAIAPAAGAAAQPKAIDRKYSLSMLPTSIATASASAAAPTSSSGGADSTMFDGIFSAPGTTPGTPSGSGPSALSMTAAAGAPGAAARAGGPAASTFGTSTPGTSTSAVAGGNLSTLGRGAMSISFPASSAAAVAPLHTPQPPSASSDTTLIPWGGLINAIAPLNGAAGESEAGAGGGAGSPLGPDAADRAKQASLGPPRSPVDVKSSVRHRSSSSAAPKSDRK